jgi:hypothetical protein
MQTTNNVTQERNEVMASLLNSEANGTNGHQSTSGGMQKAPITKYRPFAPIPLKDRTWPDQQITRAPIWCSVDLRDGNQALAIPMSVEEKLEMFQLLVEVGLSKLKSAFLRLRKLNSISVAD